MVGYACTWLSFTCSELGLFAEGIAHGERAQKIAESFPSDQYLFFKSLAGLSMIYFFMGNTHKVFEGGKRILEYGEKYSNSRSKVFGNFINGLGHWISGDMQLSQKSHEKAIEAAMDPSYAQFPKSTLGLTYFLGGQLKESENVLQSCIKFCTKRDMGEFSTICQVFLAPTLVANGHMKQGLELLENAQKTLLKNKRKSQYGISLHILGEVYSQIATGPKPSLSIMAKNIGFLVKKVPFATKNAEEHFKKAIEIFREIGAKGFLGLSYLGLGLLYKESKRTDEARQYILESKNSFNECGAELYLIQANEALEFLE